MNKGDKDNKKRDKEEKFKDTPPTVYEDPIPLEDVREEEKEIRNKTKTKNTSSTQKKETY